MSDIQLNRKEFYKRFHGINLPIDHPNYSHVSMLRDWRIDHDYPWTKCHKEKTPIKGMIFSGCSFTWGQGLYYYSNLDSLREPPPDCFDSLLVNPSHIKFMETVRYPRLVAKHFNTFEQVAPFNGGSNESAIEYCMQKLFLDPDNYYKPADFSDYSHCVFQMTQWQRKHIFINYKGQQLDIHNNIHKSSDILTDYLLENNITIEDWEEYGIQLNVHDVKTHLQFLESKGIKTYLLTWPDYYVKYIEKDSWLKERHIVFDVLGYSYNSLESLMNAVRTMTIKYDFQEFNNTPKDHHPSLRCHRLIADTLIKRIENE